MPTVFCTQCGTQNREDSRFCANCGAALTRSAERSGDTTSTLSLFGMEAATDVEAGEEQLLPSEAIEALPAGSALLVVKRGPNAGSRFLLDRDLTTAGRHPESDIFLDDVTVSRRHAEFVRQGVSYVVRDVGSLNGTYLNRERIDESPLANRDEVQIGKFRLVFLASPRATAEGRRASA